MSACTGVTGHRGWSRTTTSERGEALARQDESYAWFVGIDWATQVHQVGIVDDQRGAVTERRVDHGGAAIGEFIGWLVDLAAGRPERVGVAIEIPRGALVEALVERGIHVYAINPKQLDRFRDRHTVAGAKDDRRDAFVLAASLRTDQPAFRRVRLEDPLIIELRE
jgi:transposase